MKAFNIEEFIKDNNSSKICELHLNERQVPFAGFPVDGAVYELKPLYEFDVLTSDTCNDIIKDLERLFDISIDKDMFVLQKDELMFIVGSGKVCSKISITLRKSLNKNAWI